MSPLEFLFTDICTFVIQIGSPPVKYKRSYTWLNTNATRKLLDCRTGEKIKSPLSSTECVRLFPPVLESLSHFILIYSLTKTKNCGGRNEVTETSGSLHPLWPQNKRLHTPRTTDYRHCRQDRWMQTELAFTLAKNATTPNPFEIIPLQTTRKENNWKTEEALARVAVTLETERMKGSNPWYLWWWSSFTSNEMTIFGN